MAPLSLWCSCRC
ncbi:hypothetical protein MTR67_031792 [Solanum verrucosum]|nr:hypothetical protein MTR67_031792 [Solanum verrucosum]